ncbi:MAG: hypothetical protein GY708_21440 [Actinomycetia bacterium]|nr:hypothetical protein [Actinomycetes bacterium]MCP4961482.1 hypothetical protein [Actinomycetes bacterium]
MSGLDRDREGAPTRRRVLAHVAAWVLGVAVFRVGLIAPQSCPGVTVDELDHTIEQTVGWATTNLLSNGEFLYRYDRSSNTDLGGYNPTRHAAMTNALYQVAAAGDLRWIRETDRTLDYMLRNLVTTSDVVDAEAVAFAVGGARPRIGASALLVAAMAHRRTATGETTHDAQMRLLGQFLVGQIESNGAVAAEWDPGSREPVWGEYGIFATGEVAWALALLDETFPGEGWAGHGITIVEYVIHDRRAHEGLTLRAPDHWVSYATAELGDKWEPTPDESEYLRRLAGDFAVMIRVESQRSGAGIQKFLRFGQALGAGVGALGEGLAGLSRTPSIGDERDELEKHLVCTAGVLVDRQVDESDVVSDPTKEVGAWFKDDITQVDDQQHTLSTLLFAREVLTRETRP